MRKRSIEADKMNDLAQTAFLARNALVYANAEFKVKSWLMQ